MQADGESRSQGSSPLLVGASAPPSLPTFTPIASPSTSSLGQIPIAPMPVVTLAATSPAVNNEHYPNLAQPQPTPILSTNKLLTNLLNTDDNSKSDQNANK